MCVHGGCSLSNAGMPKQFLWLAWMQAKQTLRKITASHFQVLLTQFANIPQKGSHCRICLIAKRIRGGGGDENPSFMPASPGTKQCMRSQSKLHFKFISHSKQKNKVNPNIVLIEFQHATPVECC